MLPTTIRTTVRALRPTDLLALMSRTGGAGWWNAAKPRSRLSGDPSGPALIGSLLERMLPIEGHSRAWVCYEGNDLRGFLAARQKTGPSIWEVEALLLGGEDHEEVSLPLLESLSREAWLQGVQKVFLRLPEESPLLPSARRAGYVPYLRETLFVALHPAISEAEAPPGLRPRRRNDAPDLFRLYTSLAPAWVRQAEGLTLQEWQETRDRRVAGRRTRQWLLIQDGIQAWLSVQREGRTGFLDLLATPAAPTEELVRFGLQQLRCQVVLCLVPEYQALGGVLEDLAFSPVAAYVSLVKPLAVRVPQARLVPVRA